ncbi:hypothetical protein R1sor_024507 [Riccia sorocarpa]|uniref:Uncharacterized protein n=1 Tax=Riccia sorocarpa TaxID=122646 RepID=A0ABD3GUT1_9MARC
MNLMDVANSDPGRIIPKSSEFNRKRTKTTLPDISRNLQRDFGGIDPSDSDPSWHLSGSGSSPSSDSEDSTDFSLVKIAEDNLGLSPLRLLPGFAASIRRRKQFLASMSPPRELFSQFPTIAPLGNAETEEHEEDAQDENEDNGPFASEALSDSEEDKSPEHVVVTWRRFKETLREEKPPRVQVGNSRKLRLGEVDSGFVLSKLTPECLVKEQRQFRCKKTCVWNLGINRLRSERKRYFRLSRTERSVYLESLVTKLESGGVVFRLSQNLTPADGKYHLPNNFTKKEVYDHYKTDMVQVRESEAVQALKLHRKQQAEERAAARRRRWKALDSPKDYAYIQIDRMDQKKTALPHFSKQPKSVDGAALVGVHLVGAMIFHCKLHTYGDRAILASEQVPLKSYAEIKRQTRRVQNIGPLIGRQEGEAVRHVQAIKQDIQTHCYPFFDDEQKDWWNHWFVQQEEIGRNIGNNRRERLVGDMCWFWPVPPERDEHAVDEPVAVTTTEEFRRRIFGQRRPIYSGHRRPAPGSAAADRAAHIGELTEIQEKSFLAVLADDETSFWICQVLKINRRNEEGEPTCVHIQWYAT